MAQQQQQQQQQQPKGMDMGDNRKDGSHLFVFTNDKAGMKRTSVDKERTNRIIYEMSKNSLYFKQAELQDQKVDAKVSEMKAKLRLLDSPRKAHLLRQADRIATELETQRELDGVCIVVDMDMFYAAVEIRDRPELADKPVAVGGESMISTTNYHARKWGVRSAMPGFIGRKLCPQLVFVRPDFEKYKRVAEQIRAIFCEYDPRMRSYSLDEAYLNVTQAVLKRLDPAVGAEGSAGASRQRRSVDSDLGSVASFECPLSLCPSSSGTASAVSNQAARNKNSRNIDIEYELPKVGLSVEARGEADDEADEEEGGDTDGVAPVGRTPREERRARMFEAAQSLAEEIRERIRGETKLTVSVGIGPNFMLAKIASDWNKPNGQFCVRGDRAEVLRFLHDLPVRKVGGVGKVMEKRLREALGVVTCGDLYRERAACMHVMTPNTSRWLIKASLGIGSSDHDVATEQTEAAGVITRKQISKERTFGELHRPQDLLAKCREICDALATEMESKGLEAKTVGLKIKMTRFQVRTLDSTGNVYISTAADLYAAASTLLQREIRGAASSSPGGQLRLRLMGVRASSFRGQAAASLLPGQPTLDGFLAPTPDHRPGGAAVVEGKMENGPKNDDTENNFSRESCGEEVVDALEKQAAFAVDRSGNAAAATAQVRCPVCGGYLGAVSNAALNRHVDVCLGVETPDERGDAGGMMPSAKRAGGGGFGSRRPKRPKAPKLATTRVNSIERFLGPR